MTATDDYEVSVCPICWTGPVRLAILTGEGWLTGRSWKLCFGCLSKVERFLETATWDRVFSLDLTSGEQAVCAMLRIDARDARTHGWLQARLQH